MKILVTGANGQLGSELRSVASSSKHDYIFTDVAELDIADIDAIFKFMETNKIEVVINCAAYTNVDKAEDDERTANLINRDASENLAVACKVNNAMLIHVSTDYVFGGKSCLPLTEEQPTSPIGAYGRTKLAGERAIQEVGCRYMIFRTSWLYSEFGNNFVKTMMRLTNERDNLNVVFDQVGTPTYAADLASTIVHIIENDMLDKEGIYHFSNEGVCSWYDFAIEIASLAGNVCDIKPCHSSEFPSKVERPSYSVLDKTKVKTTFGVKIPYWKESLKECMNKIK
mgnify:FL=1